MGQAVSLPGQRVRGATILLFLARAACEAERMQTPDQKEEKGQSRWKGKKEWRRRKERRIKRTRLEGVTGLAGGDSAHTALANTSGSGRVPLADVAGETAVVDWKEKEVSLRSEREWAEGMEAHHQ
jgi:hypothetical protein